MRGYQELGEGKMGSDGLTGTEFLLGVMEKFWK